MSVEPWRKRGFVPDSDEEDEFDSLNTNKENVGDPNEDPSHDEIDLNYIPVPSATADPEKNDIGQQLPKDGPDGQEGLATSSKDIEIKNNAEQDAKGSHELKSSPLNRKPSSSTPLQETGTVSNGGTNAATPLSTRTLGPRRSGRKYGRTSSAAKLTKTDDIWNVPSSPVQVTMSSRKSQSHTSTPKDTSSAKTIRTGYTGQIDTPSASTRHGNVSSRESSPDELMVLVPSPRKPPVSNGQDKRPQEPHEQPSSDDESSLSSARSNLSAPSPEISQAERIRVEQETREQDDSARILPDLEVPEEFLQPSSQPELPREEPDEQDIQNTIQVQIPDAQQEPRQRPLRSLRTHRPEQMNPYTFEYAKYSKLMNDAGVPAVRQRMEDDRARRARTAADESQVQDNFDPNAIRSSPPAEEYMPASRPERRNEQETPQPRNKHNDQHSLTIRRKQSSKRRKRSRSGAWHDGTHLVSNDQRPQVVLDSTPPARRLDPSIFDFPSSPPQSGSVSSTSRTPRASEGFRFPPGFTPPTTVVDSHTVTPEILDDPTVIDDAEPGSPDEELSSDSSGEELETAEEREIRRMSRQTRGVLPASWHRLDAQQRLQKQKASQVNRQAPQRADAKGVAKKLLRRSGQPVRLSQMDFGDDDESDEDGQSEKTPQANEENADEALARVVGFENPFGEAEEEDIFEDNRVDYMFPSASRNAGLPRKKPSLKRAHTKGNESLGDRRPKKPRLQRQTRITDSSYGSRRTKKSNTKSAPRLGILDAPDVANQPHKEQPQFLRVAARRARSRRDGGRQSPTRKFLQLGSRRDTADANESLGAWRRGAIPQTKIQRPRSKPSKTQPAASRPRNRQTKPTSSRNSRLTSHFPVVNLDNSPEPDNQSAHGQLPDTSHQPPVEVPRNSTSSRSLHATQRGHQWVVERNTAISSLHRNDPRPAVGNMSERTAGQLASRARFGQSLNHLNREHRHRYSSIPRTFRPTGSLTLDRFISEPEPTVPSAKLTPQQNPPLATERRVPPQESHRVQPAESHKSRRRLKKHPPTRINLTLDEFVQDPAQESPIPELEVLSSTGPEPLRTSGFNVGGGLFNWQPSYPLDFGVLSLDSGSFFHESTFIGSGEFSRSIQILKRDLDRNAGLHSLPFKNHDFQWGAWNEKVSSEMGLVFEALVEDIESLNVSASESILSSPLSAASVTFRGLISYVTEKLTFTDPIDRAGFLSRSLTLSFKLRDPITAFLASSEKNEKDLVRIACYNMVFSNQIRQIATHDLVNPSFSEEAVNLVKLCAKDTISLILSETGRSEMKRLLEANGDDSQREMGIRNEFPSTEAYVIAEKLLRSSNEFGVMLRDLEVEVYAVRITRNKKDISNLETAWGSLFMHLPFHELDNQGIVRRELRIREEYDNWILVKKLLSPVFESRDFHSKTQTISYNAYCRTLFQRCHRLINHWGWRECKTILDTLYDFFAHKTLYNLELEEGRGSPSFLDDLDQNPSLEIRPGEPTFHTLLKCIASGLRFLSKRYDSKKIRNFAWRYMPNHGRMYPKEEPLRHEDLDALRNHHDLICTLYWLVADGFRPRVETIKDLVNPATSHVEACNINLKSWTRLVRFKLSTDEDVSGLEPFADWHSYFINELRKQHQLARNEIESQRKEGVTITQQLIDYTISENQRQIESLLSTALSGMLSSVERAPSLEHAHRLMSRTPFESLLSLFDPKASRVNKVVSETLAVIVAYTRKDGVTLSPAAAAVPPPEDDSQEYGDWDDIDAVMTQTLSEGIQYVQYVLHPVVSRLVSNCFGEDHCPEDAILLSTVDCWTSVAQVLVRHGLRRWEDYLDPFGEETWTRLRETVQTRKFSPQFLAMCIEKDNHMLSECRILVMKMWLSSLVERSSLLKFQHRLTEALLNGIPEDPLLRNLPFSKDMKSNRYQLTIDEVTERRISLISSVLSNMRGHLLQLEVSNDRGFLVSKREYSELLHQLMTAMKKNYRDLGNGNVEAAQGAYVEFVHRIIRFLQELTTDIRPVDPFFTDSALFPLPSSDPQYIVAKLKRYEPKLSSKKDIQTLIMFVQSIVERAVLEGQQDHLTEQLHSAMVNTFEAGKPDKPTLRAVLLQCIFPGYLELAFSTPTAWLLSRPIVRSMTLVFKDLLFDIDATDLNCVSSVLGIFKAVFHSVYRALHPLSNHSTTFRNTSTLVLIAAFIEMVSSTLVVLDYIDRLTDQADQLISYIQWFRDFSVAVLIHLDDVGNPISALNTIMPVNSKPEGPAGTSTLPAHLSATRDIALEEHQSCLKNWSSHGNKYYHIRTGHDSKEVTLEPQIAFLVEGEAQAKKTFIDVVDEFTNRIDQLELLPDE